MKLLLADDNLEECLLVCWAVGAAYELRSNNFHTVEKSVSNYYGNDIDYSNSIQVDSDNPVESNAGLMRMPSILLLE